MDIYVGNLPYSVEDGELGDIFSPYGAVAKASVIMDRETGRSKGFGFVEMPDDQAARSAIEALGSTQMGGRTLTVNEARPRQR